MYGEKISTIYIVSAYYNRYKKLYDLLPQVDCVMFGHLTHIVYFDFPFPHKKILSKECTNIRPYLDRIKERFWPDWDTLVDDKPFEWPEYIMASAGIVDYPYKITTLAMKTKKTYRISSQLRHTSKRDPGCGIYVGMLNIKRLVQRLLYFFFIAANCQYGSKLRFSCCWVGLGSTLCTIIYSVMAYFNITGCIYESKYHTWQTCRMVCTKYVWVWSNWKYTFRMHVYILDLKCLFAFL